MAEESSPVTPETTQAESTPAEPTNAIASKPSDVADPATPAVPTEPPVSLKAWAQTSAKNRELSTKLAERDSKIAELESKLAAPADDDTKYNERLLAEIKSPGFARRLLKDGGKSFDDVVAEMSDLPGIAPEVLEAQRRIDAIEAERKAEKDAQAKLVKDAQDAQHKQYVDAAKQAIAQFAKDDTTIVEDEKDARNGTKRWAIVSRRPDLIDLAHENVAETITTKFPQGVTQEQAEKLVADELDAAELLARVEYEPIVQDLVKRPINGNTDRSRRTIELPDLASPKRKGIQTITSDLRGPAPTKTNGRFSGGPRRVTYTD